MSSNGEWLVTGSLKLLWGKQIMLSSEIAILAGSGPISTSNGQREGARFSDRKDCNGATRHQDHCFAPLRLCVRSIFPYFHHSTLRCRRSEVTRSIILQVVLGFHQKSCRLNSSIRNAAIATCSNEVENNSVSQFEVLCGKFSPILHTPWCYNSRC